LSHNEISNREFDILSALKGEDSHGTAPLDWDVQDL
jgi:hypothetical protein